MTESTTRDEGLGRHIQPLYRPLEAEGPIVIYAGELQVSKDSAEWLSPGNVELRLKPSPTVEARFSGREQWLREHLWRRGFRLAPTGCVIRAANAVRGSCPTG